MKFLADNMLGRLATWLRLLGYDTTYLPHMDDPELAQIARAEHRVLLTRDVELTRRRGLRFVLIESDHVADQVHQVFRELHLSAHEAFSRCAECNVPIEDAPIELVRDDVPAYVLRTHTRFRRCPQCRRVYWRGTHWARMLAQIEEITAARE
ncbi:MAG: Mut7-C RNAse domain-containing protein [Chloroflexi bacterium]|nr:Mut7-C RNAse domain-containing protein [Chloroflexota bacterium]